MDILDKIPQDLLRLKNPPKTLYYKGNTDLLQMPKIAVVGSLRKISFYTKNLISILCLNLKKYGICVVSGGAIGYDITAHSRFSNTIAVFANGLNIIYPKTIQI